MRNRFVYCFLGKLEDSVEQQTLLLNKIENYLVYLNSTEFKKDFFNVST